MVFGGSKGKNNSGKQQKPSRLETEQETSVSSTIADFSKDTTKKVGSAFKDIGKGLFQQILSQQESVPTQEEIRQLQELQKKQENPEEDKKSVNRELGFGTVFSFREIEERRQMSEIKQLIEAIKQEVEEIKRADKALMSEVSDIEKLTIDTMPEKTGIYHVRFLEIVLKVLQSLKLKISESGTWMEALKSKKAKRGSAFAARSNKKGTQYSMSQEISTARSVQ